MRNLLNIKNWKATAIDRIKGNLFQRIYKILGKLAKLLSDRYKSIFYVIYSYISL